MEQRTLGRTGLTVGAIGIGAEHLLGPCELIIDVTHEAIDHGANYFDIIMGEADYRDAFGKAFQNGYREKAIIAGHLGTVLTDAGQGWASRDITLCTHYYEDYLRRLNTDYLDVAMIQFVDEEDDYARVLEFGGLLTLAQSLKEQGKVRFIGMSSHMTPVAMKAVESGLIDVLMFSINPAFDVLPGYNKKQLDGLWADAGTVDVSTVSDDGPSRKDLYRACAQYGVGLVAMKPYAAGWLFKPEWYSGQPLTAIQCLSYALSQPGVSSVIPGVKNLTELRAALHYTEASSQEKDFSNALADSRWNLRGACMYCKHCMPCPVGIDIAATNRLIDTAIRGVTPALVNSYQSLITDASACVACGICSSICPFQVDVASKMQMGVKLFKAQ